MARGRNREKMTRSSGNVFADLRVPRAKEKQTKVRLAVAIHRSLTERRLAQTAAADLLGINQPKISALVNYQLAGFSVERLLHFLNALGCDVEIVVRRKANPRKSGKILVSAA